jgi:hypothetical protein
MSVSPIVTLGFGSSIYHIPTLGFGATDDASTDTTDASAPATPSIRDVPPPQSRFDSRLGSMERLFDTFGEQVLCVDQDGSRWPLPGIVGDERSEQRTDELGTETVITREITVPMDAMGRHEFGGMDKLLAFRGKIIAGGLEYAVEDIETSRAGMAVFRLKRIDSAEVAHQNYRRYR